MDKNIITHSKFLDSFKKAVMSLWGLLKALDLSLKK